MTEALKFLEQHGIRPADLVGGWLGDTDFSQSGFQRRFAKHLNLFRVRDLYIERYGFAVITPAIISTIKKCGPIIEIGAGSGYWAYELRKAGVDIIATEPQYGRYFTSDRSRMDQWPMWTKPYVKLEKISGVHAVKKYPKRALLTVWPDYSLRWSYDALRAFTGNTVLYVGEGYGGCTGCDSFHQLLENNFQVVEVVQMPQFFGLHDRLYKFRR